MNDPHVVALIYHVTHSEEANFDDAETLEFETSQFSARVENGTARFELKNHYSDESEARSAIEPFIHVWETWDALNPELSGFVLEYSTADIVDRNPPSGNYANLVLSPIKMSAHGVKNIGRRHYPEPPTEEAAMNADVAVMAYRYWIYRQSRDTLSAMAYFCLTVLENSAGSQRGKRRRAARHYNIEEEVLAKLGELTATKGGRFARKGHGVAHEFSPSEQRWIEFIIMRLIRRAAEVAQVPEQELPAITMPNHPI